MAQDMNWYNPNDTGSTPYHNAAKALPTLMTKVYLWMTLALAITGLTACCVAQNEALVFGLLANRMAFWVLMLAELGIVIFLSARIMHMSFATAGIMFGIYSLINGVVLSSLLLVYTSESLTSTFLITAGTFAAMSFIGAVTKRDLGAFGRFLFMALIGLIIASIVNVFIASSTLSWGLSFAGVLIFSGLTAYDTQKMKRMLVQYEALGEENLMKIALLCSLSLYLDFINLFLYLLRFLGARKN